MNTSELAWFKSSYSGSDGDSCIEVAVSGTEGTVQGNVHVRDSKLRRGPQLAVAAGTWERFVSYAAQA